MTEVLVLMEALVRVLMEALVPPLLVQPHNEHVVQQPHQFRAMHPGKVHPFEDFKPANQETGKAGRGAKLLIC